MTHEIRGLYPALPAEVEVIDCTLRDGEQAPGVWFSIEEKLTLARLLSAAGVYMLDAGFPAASGADLEAMQEMRRMKLPIRLAATARPLGADVAAAEKAHAHEVFLFMPTSDIRITQTLGINRTQAGALFRRGAEDVVARGMGLNLVFEDATRADPKLIISMARDIMQHVEVTRIVVCDTVGCAYPDSMERLVTQLRAAFENQVALCTHCHNDFGLAVANTLAAVSAGARAVTCTVNGIGERAGNADLAETVAALTHLYGVKHGVDPKSLPLLAEKVERMSGLHTSPTKPVTGFNVYRHESGVHVDGMLKDARSYEYLPSAWVGCETEYVLGKHSGTALVRHLMEQAGLNPETAVAQELLRQVKEATQQRSKTAHERAFAYVREFRRRHLSGLDPATVLSRVLPAAEEAS
jgi:isopropylmalate/homocitrate/citramalate synthase